MLDSMFEKKKEIINENKVPKDIPDGLWFKCDKCKKMIYKDDIETSLYVCTSCGYHFRITAPQRIDMLCDEGSFQEIDRDLIGEDPLNFPGYKEKLEKLRMETGLNEAVITGIGKINGINVALGVMDNRFLMGSMGYAVGEKITRLILKSIEEGLPLIIFSTSGGARMQEGIISLMQMEKTSKALAKHNKEGLLYISYLTDPTTGGVSASFAMLGDIILAEPGALIGFAGPRVIEQTIRQRLPEGFQTSEFLLEHGFIDRVVDRRDMKNTLSTLLKMHLGGESVSALEIDKKIEELERKIEELKIFSFENNIDLTEEIKNMEKKLHEMRNDISSKLTPWDRVMLSRMNERPTSLDYIDMIFDDFIELHGDRLYGDDPAVVGGIAFLNGTAVTVIGEQKGRNTKENLYRNFGMPHPEGYRKALRLMKQAEKFKRPIITFVDTPGAYCGIGAEERGQAEAIARNLMEMSSLETLKIAIVIGEGSSGGALAISVADEVWMLENAVYSILSPEGFASILWKDASRAKEAAQVMKMTAFDLKEFGIISKIIKEPIGGAHKAPTLVAEEIKRNLIETLKEKGY